MARPKRTQDFSDEALDALLGDTKTADELSALFRQIQKRLAERILAGELTAHLGYAPGEDKPADQPNVRNGSTPKTVLTDTGALALEIPRDRAGTFRPQLVPTGVRRLPQFDANVLSLYARGVSVREIQGHLEQLYQVEVSPSVISAVTDEVMADVQAWQQRPLDRMYPVVIFDALRVKIRDEGTVKNKAVYLALGIDRDGHKEVLGLWIEQTEGASFWLRVMTELHNRGVEDILIALIDGLVGFPDAIHAVFPKTQIHHCVVHLVRQSLAFASWKERKTMSGDLPSPDGGGRHAGARRLRRGPVGHQVPRHRRPLAPPLGARAARVRVSQGDPAPALYHQCHREPAHAAPEDREDPRPLPDGRGRHQVAVPRAGQHPSQMATRQPRLEGRLAGARDSVS